MDLSQLISFHFGPHLNCPNFSGFLSDLADVHCTNLDMNITKPWCRRLSVRAKPGKILIHFTNWLINSLFQYPKSILNGKYKISGVRDLTTGYDSNQLNNEAILPVSKSSQMITFTFENGLTITLRTSGTEPKIKYYSELRAPPEQR